MKKDELLSAKQDTADDDKTCNDSEAAKDDDADVVIDGITSKQSVRDSSKSDVVKSSRDCHVLSTLFSGWATYVRQSVVFAGLSLALLYMTVLGFDSITVGQMCLPLVMARHRNKIKKTCLRLGLAIWLRMHFLIKVCLRSGLGLAIGLGSDAESLFF